jgi:hypothetical protein
LPLYSFPCPKYFFCLPGFLSRFCMKKVDYYFTSRTQSKYGQGFFIVLSALLLWFGQGAQAQDGAALNFDGANDHVNLDNDFVSGSYTKEAWIRISAHPGSTYHLITCPGRHALFLNADKLAAGNNGATHVSNPATFPLNQWVHVAVTYDAATTTMRLYQDAELVASNTSVPTISGAVTSLFLGRSTPSAGTFFAGIMDEVRIWNLARTRDQLYQIRQCEPSATTSPGLTAYYRFNQGIADGDNTGIGTSLDPVVGPIGSLVNFTLNGSASNFTLPGGVVSGTNCIFWDSGDWAPTPPVATDDAIILNGPAEPLTFECRNLFLSPGVQLNLTSGQVARVERLVDYSGATIEVQNGGGLAQSVLGTLNSTTSSVFRVFRDDANDNVGYNFISSPVPGATMASIGNNTGFTGFRLLHNPANAPGARWVAVAGSTVLESGRGYTYVQPSGSSLITFVHPTDGVAGRPYNGDIAVTLAGASGYNFNLVGNPYPSAIALDGPDGLFTNNTSVIQSSAWLWQDDNNGTGGGSYLVRNLATAPNEPIAVGQGFFVNATTFGSAGAFFNNFMRVSANPEFIRGEEDMTRLRLEVIGSTRAKDQLWVVFGQQFTDRYENGYDAEKLDGYSTISLAAEVRGQRLAVAALPNPGRAQDFSLPLTLLVRNAGTYTFTPQRVPNPIREKLFLEDRQTGEFYYLQEGRSHALTLQAGNYRDRFFLRRASELRTGQLDSPTKAYAFGARLFVDAREATRVRVVDLLGVEVAQFAEVPAGGLRSLAVSVPISGIYLVKLQTASETSELRVWLEKE